MMRRTRKMRRKMRKEMRIVKMEKMLVTFLEENPQKACQHSRKDKKR